MLKTRRLKTHHFHAKLSYQKSMLRKIEWWVQNGPIVKNGVLPVPNLLFWKFCLILRISYKELLWCPSNPNVHIPTFCKRWSFIWRCFFHVSILKFWAITLEVFNRWICAFYLYGMLFFNDIGCSELICKKFCLSVSFL